MGPKPPPHMGTEWLQLPVKSHTSVFTGTTV